MEIRKGILHIKKIKLNSLHNIPELLIFFILFLGVMNFENRYYYFLYFAFLMFVVFYQCIIPISWTSAWLLIFAASILSFSDDTIIKVTYFFKPFVYFIMYLLGYNLIKIQKNDLKFKEKGIQKMMTCCAIALFVHCLLNFMTNVGSANRNIVDYWTKTTMSATGQAMLAGIVIGYCCAILFSSSKLGAKICAFISLGIILFYNLILAGRTLVLMIAILLLVSFAYYFWHVKNKQKWKILGITLLVILVIIACYERNVMQIQDTFENSNFYYRFFSGTRNKGFFEDSRFALKMQHMKLFWKHTFGGGHIRAKVGNYSHDLFLDTHDEVGIFGFISILFYVMLSIIRMFKVLKQKSVTFLTKQLVLCVYVAVYMAFMLEPILAGMPWMLALFCFLDGGITMLNSFCKNNIEE